MRNPTKYVALILCLFAISGQALAQKLKQDPALRSGKLKNGFKYYIYTNKEAKGESSLRLFVNAGSLQEDEDQRGLAHFIEHMAFNGTTHYQKNDLIAFLESKGVKFGADLNAHTSFDETVYKVTINTSDEKNLEKAIDIMADLGFGITFDSTEIEKERGVVLEEWRLKQGADNRLRDQYLPVLFHNSRYAQRLPIGSTDVIKHASRARIVDFYKKWYRPDLMSIAVVSDADPKLVESYIKKEFSQYKAASRTERTYYDLPAHADTLYSILTDKEASSVEFSIFRKLPAFSKYKTEQDFRNSLTRTFFNSLIKKRFSRISQFQDAYRSGSLSISGITLKNGMVAGGVSLYQDQIIPGIREYLKESERIKRYGFTSAEISLFQKEYLAALKRASETEDKTTSANYADKLHDTFYEGAVMLSREERNRLAAKYAVMIDSLALLNYMRSMDAPGNTVVLLTAPEKLAKSIPGKEELRRLLNEVKNEDIQPWTDHLTLPEKLLTMEPNPGKVIATDTISEIGVTKCRLSNGTTVYLKKTTDRKNYFSITGFRDGGIYALDSADYITAQFVKPVTGLSGAGPFSRAALTEYLNGSSASATLVLSNTREGVAGSASSADARTMFRLMYLKWMYPNNDTITFAQSKRKAIENAESSKASPAYEYSRAIADLLKGEDDYSTDITAEKIETVQSDRIIPIFKKRFGSAKDFQFIIVGDFQTDSLQTLVEQYIGGLPSGEYEKEYKYHGPQVEARKKDILIHAGKAPKSTVNLFWQSQDVHYDYPEIAIQKLLQEALKVKLRINLREQHSGVYGVNVAVSATSKPAPLIRSRVSFSCAPEAADELIRQAKIEIQKVAEDPSYIAGDLVNIKTQEIKAYNKSRDKNLFWSSAIRNKLYYGFKNYDYFNNFETMVNSITARQVSDYARKYLLNAAEIKAVLMPETAKNITQKDDKHEE